MAASALTVSLPLLIRVSGQTGCLDETVTISCNAIQARWTLPSVNNNGIVSAHPETASFTGCLRWTANSNPQNFSYNADIGPMGHFWMGSG
jgi:hypothetical protein